MLPVGDAPAASRRSGGSADRRIAPPADALDAALARLVGRARRPVIIVGHGARVEMDAVRRRSPSRSTRRCSPRSRPRASSPTTTRSARGVLGRSGTPVASLADERVRPAARVRRVVLEPHRHRAVQADRPGRLRPDGARPVPPGRRSPCSATSASPLRALLDASWRRGARRGRPARRRRRRAGRSGGRRRRAAPPTTAGRGVASAAVFDALSRHVPDDAVIAVDVGNNAYSFGRYFECTRPVGADVGLPRLDRLRLSRRDGRVGRGARTARSSRSPATAASASTSPSSPPR